MNSSVIWRVTLTLLVLRVSIRVSAQTPVNSDSSFSEGNSCGCPNKESVEYTCDSQFNMKDGCSSQLVIDGDLCAFSCGRCICMNGCKCTDQPPTNDFTCQQLSDFGKCSEPWILVGDYCQASCSRCPQSCINSQEELSDASLLVELQNIVQTPQTEVSNDYEYSDRIQLWSATQNNYYIQPISVQPNRRSQHDINQDCTQDLLSMLDKQAELSYMKNVILGHPALKYYELYSRSQPLTWFVPTNSSLRAFIDSLTASDIFNNQANLWELFSGHIVRGYYSREDLYKVDQLETIRRTQNITINSNVEQQQIYVGDLITTAKVIEADLRSCVSVIHVLDGVIVHPNSPIKAFMPEYSSSPSKQTTTTQTNQKGNCLSPLNLINSDPQLKFLASLVKIAQVEEQLDETATNVTIFVPITLTQADEKELLQLDTSVIKQLVLYHMVPNKLVNITEIKSSDQEGQQSQKMFTLLSKQFFDLIVQQEDTLLQGVSRSARVVQEDFRHSCTVVIHTIDQFIEPYPDLLSGEFESAAAQGYQASTQVPSCYISAWDFLLSQEDLQILQTIPISEVDEKLLRPEPNVTIFLPDPASLQYLLSISKLLSSPDQSFESTEQILYDLILYHIVKEDLVPDLMKSVSEQTYKFDTMASSLPVYATSMQVQGVDSSASVVSRRSDCAGSGLQVYYMNGYLLPFSNVNMGMEGFPSKEELSQDLQTYCNNNNSLAQYLRVSAKFQRLVGMLGDDLDRIVSTQGSATATYFLPTDDAIDQLLQNQDIANMYQSQVDLGSLILQYHAISNQLLSTKSILQMPNRYLQNYLTKFNGLQIGIQKIFGGLMLTGKMGVARVVSLEAFVSCDVIVHIIDKVLFPFEISNTSAVLTEQLSQNQETEYQFSSNYEVSMDYSDNVPLEFVQPEAIIDTNVNTYEVQLDTQYMVVSPVTAGDTQNGDDSLSFLGGLIPAPVEQALQLGQQARGCDRKLGSINNDRFTTALQYFREAGYGYLLDKVDADFTLFAPINEAFDLNLVGYNMSLTEMRNRPEMYEQFTKIMKYHIVLYPVSGNVPYNVTGMFTTQAFDDDGYPLSVKMRKYKEAYALRETIFIVGQVNNATVSGSQLRICDAFIYPIDRVLSLVKKQAPIQYIPPPVYDGLKPSIDLSSLIPNNSQLSLCLNPMHQIQNQNELVLFNQMIHYANFSSHINAIQNITIFAPIDAGISQLLGPNITLLPKQHIEPLIAYHIVQGVYTLDNLMQGQKMETLQVDSNGVQMSITIDIQQNNDVLLKGKTNFAKIVRQNITACNSIIHIIDAPLSPW